MANPTTLQELADSLATIANYNLSGPGPWTQGYRTALLDTRATVLAMITAERNLASIERDISGSRVQRIAQARELLAEYDGPDPWDSSADEGEWCEAFVMTVRPLIDEPNGPGDESTESVD